MLVNPQELMKALGECTSPDASWDALTLAMVLFWQENHRLPVLSRAGVCG